MLPWIPAVSWAGKTHLVTLRGRGWKEDRRSEKKSVPEQMRSLATESTFFVAVQTMKGAHVERKNLAGCALSSDFGRYCS